MSTPTSAISASAVRLSTPGMVESSATCTANGAITRSISADSCAIASPGEVELGEDLADQQPVVGAEAAPQRLPQCRELGAQLPPSQLGQHLRVAGAAHQRGQHVAAGAAEDVAGHAGQLDPGVLQDLVQPLRLPGALLDLRLAVAGQVAQLADRLGRHERGAHQAVLDQLADPLRILDVGLAAGHVAQVAGVREPARQRILQHVVDAPPVHPGRLHADQRHLLSDQPVPQRQQLHGRGPKRTDLLGPTPVRAGGAHAGDHRVLVDVQPGAARHDDVHRSSSRRPYGPPGGASPHGI